MDEISPSSLNSTGAALAPRPGPGVKHERRQATRQFGHSRLARDVARPPCRLDRAMRMLTLIQMLLHPAPMA